jgi:sugar/nucleoside kinase (ribokinase family)
MTEELMQALFIGQTYIDVTFITDHLPTGDEKHVASDYAVSFGGNAVTAAFCCAKLGIVPDLIATLANDWLGRMFQDMCAKYGISVHPRKVNSSSLSFIMPKDGKRAIVRCRDDAHIHPFPLLNLGNCRALHVDGHQPDAAIHYAKVCREAGILTSLDGGGLRTNTHELLEYIDVAIVAERLCEQMDLTPEKMLDYLKSRGCRIGGVTMGEKGLLWYDETGAVQSLPAYADSARARDRHQRRRRRVPWRLYLFLSRQSRQKLAGAFRVRACGVDLQDPAPRQRSRAAGFGRYRRREAGIRGPRVAGPKGSMAWGAWLSPAASTWMWWQRPSGIPASARRWPAIR